MPCKFCPNVGQNKAACGSLKKPQTDSVVVVLIENDDIIVKQSSFPSKYSNLLTFADLFIGQSSD